MVGTSAFVGEFRILIEISVGGRRVSLSFKSLLPWSSFQGTMSAAVRRIYGVFFGQPQLDYAQNRPPSDLFISSVYFSNSVSSGRRPVRTGVRYFAHPVRSLWCLLMFYFVFVLWASIFQASTRFRVPQTLTPYTSEVCPIRLHCGSLLMYN